MPITSKNAINTVSDDKLKNIVSNSNTIKEILISLEVRPSDKNYPLLKKRLSTIYTSDELDTLYKNFYSFQFKNQHKPNRMFSSNMFIENSETSRSNVRRRIIKENLIPYICQKCGCLPQWDGQPLSLQLDHINGINNDNRLENLRFLCPNCHSQTDTYGSKRLKKENRSAKKLTCVDCNTELTYGKRCISCYNIYQRKVERPSIEEINHLINSGMSMLAIGRKYNVSDNAIRKWIKHAQR